MARDRYAKPTQVVPAQADAIMPDAMNVPVEPATVKPAPVAAAPSSSVLAERAAIEAQLAELARLKAAYDAAKVVYTDVCNAIEEAQRLQLAKADALDALNRAHVAHDHAQPRVRELMAALAKLTA